MSILKFQGSRGRLWWTILVELWEEFVCLAISGISNTRDVNSLHHLHLQISTQTLNSLFLLVWQRGAVPGTTA